MASKKVNYEMDFIDSDEEEVQKSPASKPQPAKAAVSANKKVNYDLDSDDEEHPRTPVKSNGAQRPKKQVKLDSSSEDGSDAENGSPNKSPIRINADSDEEKQEKSSLPEYHPPKRNAKGAAKAQPTNGAKKAKDDDDDAKASSKPAAKPKAAPVSKKSGVKYEDDDSDDDNDPKPSAKPKPTQNGAAKKQSADSADEDDSGDDDDADEKKNTSSSTTKTGEQKKTVEQLLAEKQKRFPALSDADQKKYDKYVDECPKRPYQNAAMLYKKDYEEKLFKRFPELQSKDPKKPLTFADVCKKHKDKVDTDGIIKKYEKLNEAWKKKYEEWKDENPAWAERHEFDNLIQRTKKNSRAGTATRAPKAGPIIAVEPEDSPRILDVIASNNKLYEMVLKATEATRDIVTELRNNNKKRKRVVNKD